MKFGHVGLLVASTILGSSAVEAQTYTYSDQTGNNLNGQTTPVAAANPGNNVTFSLTFNPTGSGGGGVLIDELSSGGAWHDSQLEVEPDGTVVASVWHYPITLSLGTATFDANNTVTFSYNDLTGLFSGTLNGSYNEASNGPGVRQTPYESNQPGLYYGIGTSDGTNLGNGQSFVGSISNVTISAYGADGVGGVPEPATWAMMVMGFGMVGFGLRYRRKSSKVSFA